MAMTEDEISDFLSSRPDPEARKGALGMKRADAIRAEVYRRHKIKPGTPLDEAIQQIEQRAQMRTALGVDGGRPSAWANPEERASAREEYARQGKTPAEVSKRWNESTHLLDPRTYQYMQNFGRDIDFLQSELGSQKASETLRTPRRMLDANSIRAYDSNRGERLSGAGGLNPASVVNGYQRFDTVANAALDNTSNPDVPLGNYMVASETVPNHIRLEGSGETDTSGQSWQRAQANRLANNRYRINSPHPIADLPAGATEKDIARRIAELQQEVVDASVPMADERWKRTAGFVPAGWISDAGDLAITMVDPTVLIPAAGAAAKMPMISRALSQAGRIAGSGWQRPIVSGVAKQAGKDAGMEFASEAGVGAALTGFGGMPGRDWKGFLVGGHEPAVYKSASQVTQANQAAGDLYGRLKDDDGVSRADNEAYNRLVATGALPPPGSDLHPRPQWRMNSSNKQ